MDDIYPNVIEATIISQDKNFQSHNGIDIIDIFRSGVNNLNNDTKQGGSTITQQIVKNICKFDKSNVIGKKRSEIYTDIKIDKIYSKNEIMEAYLNCLYYDNNIVEIKNASLYYFCQKTSDLTKEESAKFLTIIDNPIMYDAINQKENNEIKANIILNQI